MSNSSPMVSAVITTHNRVELLQRALDSVVHQTYPNLEIIVVDDGSTDGTQDFIRSYSDGYDITYLRNEISRGAPAARNRGIKEANGEFIAGLDDDDEWHSDRIRQMMDAFSPEWAYVSSDCYYVTPHKKGTICRMAEVTYQDMLFRNAAGNQILAPRARVLEIGGFDESLRAAQDYDLFLRLNEHFGDAINVQQPLQTIYMNHNNEDRISNNAFVGYLQFYKKHVQKFNYEQRMYQLYKIREAQGKNDSILKIAKYCPKQFLFKEVLEYTKRKVNYK